MKDIVACMITVDRRLFGKENYLSATLENLSRSGFFDCDRLSSFQLFNSHVESAWLESAREFMSSRMRMGALFKPIHDITANQNAGSALENSGTIAEAINAKWVLFMEDDLDFCSDFLGSVGRYLDQCIGCGFLDDIQLFAFGCPYPQVIDAFDDDRKYWLYPVLSFYGSQCFAIRPHDAISLGQYLQRNLTDRNPNEYDLMIHEWMRAEYPDNKYFLASVPSFVEHIGRQSVCNVDKKEEETHRNPSWQGRDWKF